MVSAVEQDLEIAQEMRMRGAEKISGIRENLIATVDIGVQLADGLEEAVELVSVDDLADLGEEGATVNHIRARSDDRISRMHVRLREIGQ